MNIADRLAPVAKAVAAAVTPIIVTAASRALERAGINVPIDPDWVETLIVSVISTGAVYLTRNRPAL